MYKKIKLFQSLIVICISFIVTPADSINKGFALFDIHLSEQDKHFLQNVEVAEFNCYNNYGHLENLEKGVFEFLKSIGNDEARAQAGALLINKMIAQVLQKLHSQTAWVTLRASLPNDLFKIPRWHTDGYFYKPHQGLQYKVACTLKGPGTLFCDPSLDVYDKFKEAFEVVYGQDLKVRSGQPFRSLVVEILKDQPVVQADTCECMIFVVGDKESAAVHSEPFVDEPRLFMSIVPGTHEQISELGKFHKSGSL